MTDPRAQSNSFSSLKKDLLAKILQGKEEGLAEEQILPFQRSEEIPASFAQKRLWFLDQLYPQNASYNVPYVLQLRGPLRLAALQRSLQELVNRHESLRTTFFYTGEKLLQRIRASLALDTSCIDLGHIAENERVAVAMQQMTDAAKRPFSLTDGPLIRVHIFRLTALHHYCFVNYHHSITDGWSENIFFQELQLFYKKFATRDPSLRLPALPLHYADYTLWQYQWLTGEVFDTQLAYWQKQLQGELPVLALPYDHPQPMLQTFKGARLNFRLPSSLSQAASHLSRQEDASLYMTMLTAFTILLHRYTRQEDMLIATPIANRTRREWEGVSGFFANTLLLRTRFSGNVSFREVLRRVRTVTLDAYAHQDLPFEKLVEKLAPHRDMSKNPLFQVMFHLDTVPQQIQLSDATGLFIDIDNQTAKFELDMQLVADAQGLSGGLEYSTDLFDEATMKRLLSHYRIVLAAMVQDPDQSIDSFDLLTSAEHRQLLRDWNATATIYPADRCLHHLFEQQAMRSPDRLAVICAERSLTYRELNRRANGLATWLCAHGVQAETRVGICMARCPEMLVAVLGILKAGGAYVPLDPYYPSERLQYMVNDASIALILTKNRQSERISGTVSRYIDLAQIWDVLLPDDENIERCTPANLLYLIYTSGSTGTPKGVALAHRPLVNLIAWQETRWVFAKPARCLQFSSLNFDLSCFEFFSTFAAGSTLVVPEDEVRNDPEKVVQLLIDQQVERACFPHVGLQQIAEVAAPAFTDIKLREIVVTGEQLHLSPPLLSWLEQLDGCVLHNHYGPSETHVVTSYLLPSTEKHWSLPPIGRPIANTQLYILDSQFHPVPAGVRGELYIAGASLARGYINAPHITGDRFLPDPFSSAPGARMYRSGDLVRYLPDGNIQFCGRLDHQVKIRGFRIEPGEIETAIQTYPGITAVIVIAREKAPGLSYLTAYYTAGEVIAGSILRTYLLGRLPEYMVPTFYRQMAALPLTPSGKINRFALPVVNHEPDQQSGWSEPVTMLEQQLADIWSTVLGQARIGRNTQFFQSGGHSLAATRLISRVRKTWQVEVPLRVIFEAPVLKDFANRIKQYLLPGHSQAAPMLPAVRLGPDPLSFAQERLWFFDQLKPGDAAYNLDYTVTLKGILHVATLEKSLNGVVQRHEALRTSFQVIDNRPVQVIASDLFLPLVLVDLQTLPVSQRLPYALHLAGQAARRPFQLHQGPLVRASIYQVTDQEFLLVVIMHHIISDGWSMHVFSRELFDLYDLYRATRAPALTDLPFQYADFARWQRTWLVGNVFQEQLSYWKQQLCGPLAATELPLDHPRPPMQSHRGAHVNFTLSGPLTRKIHRFSEQEGVSLYMALLTVFEALLHRYTGQEDLVIGTPIANRNRQEVEGLIGFFVNTLVLRVRIAKAMTWKELLAQVKQVTLAAYAHQDIPFERVVEELQPARDLSTSPLFQILFHMQNTPRYDQPHRDFSLTPLALDCWSSVFDMSISLEERDDLLSGRVEYCTDLFSEETMRRLTGHYVMLLESLLANPGQQLWQASMLTRDEQQLLLDWNQTQQPYPDTVGIHRLFEEQVEHTPDALALSCLDQQLTYRALNERANQLAHYLQTVGVQPEVLVGLYVERSPLLVIGMLATLKAGGAFLPFDPEYPARRISLLLQAAKIPVLLTQTSLATQLPPDNSLLLCLDTWSAEMPGNSSNPRSNGTPSNLAYAIYTSGSTGSPKGVLLQHKGLVNLTRWHQRAFHVLPSDRASQVAGLAFDALIWEIWPYLCSGASVHLAEEKVRRSPTLVRDWLIERAISLAFLPTPLAEAALALPWPEQLALRILHTGGDRLHNCLPAALPFTLINNYGPTENTAITTSGAVPHGSPAGSLPSIGRPIANTEVYILDHQFQPVPVGVTGDLYTGGAGLARGYLFRPELTAASFLPHPFNSQPGARLYKTGDRACYLPDGTIAFRGRTDSQVKIRGYRIELGEIEALLLAHPDVREAVVIVYEEDRARKHLVAYLATSTQSAASNLGTQQFQRYLGEHLPEYMIPTSFVCLPALPISTNGKVDRKALPSFSPQVDQDYVAPRSPVEHLLVRIWQEVLGLKRIGISENFFSLGGHSLLATQIISQIRFSLDLEVPLKLMFQSPTIAELAAAIPHLEKKASDEPQMVRRVGTRRRMQP